MRFSNLFLSALPAFSLVRAQRPDDPGFYNTVAEIYSGADCAEDTLVWLDPIFGRGGVCQLLDRNNNTPDIFSYRVTSQYPGCTATLYTDEDCLGTPYPAPVGSCVKSTDGKPFIKAFVECPFS